MILKNVPSRLAAASIVASSLFLATACGGSSGGGGGGLSGGSSSGSAAIDRDGVLRTAQTALAQSFDPIKQPSSSSGTWLAPVYDTLLYAGPDGKVQPMLATSWKFNDSPPSLDLTLRTDVKFHNGNTFDANVVKANIERAKTDTSLLAHSLTRVTSVEVADPSHVRLMTDGPVPDLPLTLSDLPGMMADPTMFNSPDLSTKGAGTGAYIVSTFKPAAEIVYTRAPSYWDPSAAKLAELHMNQVDNDDARLNQLVTGQVDLVNVIPTQIQRADAAGLVLKRAPILQTERMLFNTAKSEFGNQLVRQAINYAIDRKTLVNTILKDSCVDTSQFAPPGNIMHSNQVPADYYAYDPAKAKSLLQQAGLSNGFTFTALVVNSARYLPYAQAVQAQLADIGVKMNIRPTNAADIVNAFYVEKVGDAVVAGDVGANSPTEYATKNFLPNGSGNPGGKTTPEIQDLVAKVSTTIDDKQRATYWGQLTKAVTDYAYGAQICVRTQLVGLSRKVVGFQQFSQGNFYYRSVGMSK